MGFLLEFVLLSEMYLVAEGWVLFWLLVWFMIRETAHIADSGITEDASLKSCRTFGLTVGFYRWLLAME